jgi:hypothetical protein
MDDLSALTSDSISLCVWSSCCLINLVSIILCITIAGSKNRSRFLWGVLGFFFSFVALIILIVLPKKEKPAWPGAYGYAAPQPAAPPYPGPQHPPPQPPAPQWTPPPPGATDPTMIPQSSGGSGWRLSIVQGPGTGQSYRLGEQTRLGRATDNEIRLADAEASRYHALVRRVPNGYLITDLGSGNGTYVNGQRISQPTLINPGDNVTIGQTQIRVG